MKSPKLARWILRLALRGDTFDRISNDLEERFERDMNKGPIAAKVGYFREVISVVYWRILRPSAFEIGGDQGRASGPSGIARDIRYAVRMLRSNPVFSTISVTTLAIGIGATVTMFSAVHGVLLRPLAYEQSEELVLLKSVRPDRTFEHVAQPDAVDIRARSETLEDLAILRGIDVTLTSVDGKPQRLRAGLATNNYFDLLGARPLHGRFFGADEGTDRVGRVVVLSHSVWQSHYGGDPSLVGRDILVDGDGFTLIGVTEPGFIDPVAPGTNRAWFVMPWTRNGNRSWRGFWGLGRMKKEQTVDAVAAEVITIGAALAEEYPLSNTNHGYTAVGLKERLVSEFRPALLVMFGAVAVVLLIACANVANLLLTRAVGRESEIAIRMALGASRREVVRQLLVESFVLAVPGGLAGTALAFAGTAGLKAIAGSGIPRPESITIGWPVLAFAILASVATSVLFGLAPALRSSKPNLAQSMTEGRRTSSGAATGTLKNFLVAGQLTLAVMLLTGAGLLTKSLHEMGTVDLGVDRQNLLTFEVSLDHREYPDGTRFTDAYRALIDSIAAVAGVVSAGAASDIPLTDASNSVSVYRSNGPQPGPGRAPYALTRSVTGQFFATGGTPVVRGRQFTAADNADAPRVIIINETVANHHFPDENPLGGRLTLMGVSFEVVGVVRDVRQSGPADAVEPTVYLPYAQAQASWLHRRDMTVMVRTIGDPADNVEAVRDAVWSVSDHTSMQRFASGDALYAELTWAHRFRTVLLVVFASIATVLATVGVAGVVGYSVTQRTRELGIRRALGAGSRNLVELVLRHALTLAAVGIGIGVVGSLGVGKILARFLFQTAPYDPVVLLAVPVVLLLAVVTGALAPARNAARVDPAVTLREE